MSSTKDKLKHSPLVNVIEQNEGLFSIRCQTKNTQLHTNEPTEDKKNNNKTKKKA